MNPSVTEVLLGWDVSVPGGRAVAALVAAAMIAVVALGVRAALREHRPWRRFGLGALRIATGLGVLVATVAPVRLRERTTRASGKIAVLADVSRSMGVRGGSGARSEAAAELVRRWAREAFASRVTVRAFGEESRVSSLADLASGWPATEEGSDLDLALADAAREIPELGAVVVISDGAQRPARNVRTPRGVRVHTVAVGADEDLRDDAIVSADADPRVFLREEARVRVTLRSRGLGRTSLPVELRNERGAVLARRQVELDPHGRATIELPFRLDRLGRAAFSVAVPIDARDDVPENNERPFLVRVVRDRLRALLLVGRPTWDVRFLRAFLKRDATLDLVSFFILRGSTDLTMSSADELALIPFPTDELFREHLASFDLLIFQNFDFGPYRMAQYLPRIRDYVRAGGSLAMVGGDLSFGAGGYVGTPIAEALPVQLPNVPATAPESFVLGSFRPELVPAASRHPLIALADGAAENAAAWAALEPLDGANRVAGLAAGSTALLVHPSARDEHDSPMPLLATGAFGRGRTLAFAADGSWRWGISTAGRTGDASAYERFWDRALRWLARDPSLEPSRLETDRERYARGGRVRVTAQFRDPLYVPVASEPVALDVLDRERRRVARVNVVTDAEGELKTELHAPDKAAVYHLVATRAATGEVLGEEAFAVEAAGDELGDVEPVPSLLSRLAERSGGKFFADPAGAPRLRDLDATRVLRTELVRAPWIDPRLVLVGLVAAFLAEWAVRRRWGRR